MRWGSCGSTALGKGSVARSELVEKWRHVTKEGGRERKGAQESGMPRPRRGTRTRLDLARGSPLAPSNSLP